MATNNSQSQLQEHRESTQEDTVEHEQINPTDVQFQLPDTGRETEDEVVGKEEPGQNKDPTQSKGVLRVIKGFIPKSFHSLRKALVGGKTKPKQNRKSVGESAHEPHTEQKQLRRRQTRRVVFEIEPIKLPTLIQFFYNSAEIWEWCGYAMAIVSFVFITYVSVFSFYEDTLFEIVFFMDLIFLIDTNIRVMVEIWRYKTGVPCIVFITPYTFLQYIGDMLSLFPFERFYTYAVGDDDLAYLGFFDFYRYNRFIRFWRVYNFLGVAVKEGRVSEKLSFILEYATMYLAFIHLVSCLFYLLLPISSFDVLLQRNHHELSRFWIANLHEKKPGFGVTSFDHYVLSLSFGTAIVTTTGFGDLTPKLPTEMVVTIFVMLIGAVVLQGLFSSGLTNFELNHDAARFDLFFRVQAIQENLVYIGTTQFFRDKVTEYYNLLWNYREGVYDVKLLHQLPNSMQSDVLYDICQEMFHKSQLFRNLDESFLRTISRVVKVVLYNPDMILCAKGTYAINMFYLIQGEVRVKSKFDSERVGAILRAGAVIGEVNLLFSFPYTTTLETRTSCQLLLIEKMDFLAILETYTTTFETVRSRVENLIFELKDSFKVIGISPAIWVEYRGDSLPTGQKRKKNFLVDMRRGTGFNAIVTEDVVTDTEDTIIIDMPCLNKKYEKNHTLVYKNCLVPFILRSKDGWVKLWVKITLFRALYGAFMGPYCQVFRHTSAMEEAVCNFDESLKIPRLFLNTVDVFMEITNCVPVVGLYYKLNSGFRLKVTELNFWVDVASCLPIDTFVKNQDFPGFGLFSLVAVLRSLKLWKIIRYFNFLDDKYPSKLFIIRLSQTILVILYAMHYLACLLYAIACTDGLHKIGPPRCSLNSWLRSYQITATNPKRTIQLGYLAEELPYLISFYFSCATLSSTGFGDFNPQNISEMLFLVLFELIGFALIGYYTALLTSALSCIVRPKLLFQQKLVAIRQFMQHRGINENLQYRVIEHYTLQDQLLGGVNLPRATSHFMYDAPDYLVEDALFQDVALLFDGVPILTKLDAKSIVQITKLMRRYLIPPGSIFLRRGEVRRQMYLIARGSVGIMADNQEKPIRILEATGHFGLRDILFGEPAHHHIKTLSYCLLYEIERHDLNEMFEEEQDSLNLVEDVKHTVQEEINEMTSEYSKYRINIIEKPKTISSWIRFPTSKAENMEHCSYFEYEELFENLKFKVAFRFVLMRKTVHPAGSFAKWWISGMSLISCLTLATLVLESFMELRQPWFRIFQIVLDLINYLDIYVRIHWAYYDKRNILVCHPMMTMMNYVFDGSFAYDYLCCSPFELIIPMLERSNIYGYSLGAYWYTKLRWTRIGQVIRIPAVVQVCHNIFEWRNSILVSLYIYVTIVLCTALTAVASHIACPSTPRIWQEGDERFLPYCQEDTWAFKKTDLLDGVRDRWIYGIYYISQVIFGIGFGDMIALNRAEILLLIIIMVFGYILAICVLADITAAEVDVDETRAGYLEEMKCITLIMAREKVHWRLVRSVVEHLEHNWITSRGLQPRQLFYDLHPALEADMFRDLVGDLLKKVPMFHGLTENIVRAICQFMKKLFFQKGEHLMRIGNLEYEMYIIVSGKVWIRNADKEWLTTLGPGESFGEAAMIYGHRRKYSAIASTLVEVFVLTAQDFLAVLESYPKLQEELGGKIRGGNNLDLFEKMFASKRKAMKSRSTYELKKTRVTREINHLLEIKDHPNLEELDEGDKSEEGLLKRFQKRFIGWGTDDDNLPFIYLVSKGEKISLLLHPDCPFMKYFSSFVVWASLITPGLAAYEISFSNISKTTPSDVLGIGESIQNITKYIEYFMYLHIIFQFMTPFILFEGKYCKTFKGIAFNYLTTPSRFALDAIAAIPVFYVVDHIPEANNLQEGWRLLYLVRFLRLAHFYRVELSKKDVLSTSTFLYKITLSISSFLLMTHSLACVFYALSPCACNGPCDDVEEWDAAKIRNLCSEGGWTIQFVDDNNLDTIEAMAPWRWYIRSLYWVVTAVSTTGFGDITPQNKNETVMAIACIFCGAFILSVILSQFTSGAASLGQAHREYFYRVNLLSKYLTNIGLSNDRKYLLSAYFLMTWENSRGVNYHDATDILPLTMKIEVCHSLYYGIMRKCKLFYHIKDKTFLRQVGVRFAHAVFLTGTNIVNEGEQGDRLFIVFKGRVFGHSDKSGLIELSKKYDPGQVFGRLPGLFYDQAYTKTYRSEDHTEVLSLSQDDLLHLVKFFPEFKYKLQLLILRKYDRRTTSESIFQMKTIKKGIYDVDLKGEPENLGRIDSEKLAAVARTDTADIKEFLKAEFERNAGDRKHRSKATTRHRDDHGTKSRRSLKKPPKHRRRKSM